MSGMAGMAATLNAEKAKAELNAANQISKPQTEALLITREYLSRGLSSFPIDMFGVVIAIVVSVAIIAVALTSMWQPMEEFAYAKPKTFSAIWVVTFALMAAAVVVLLFTGYGHKCSPLGESSSFDSLQGRVRYELK